MNSFSLRKYLFAAYFLTVCVVAGAYQSGIAIQSPSYALERELAAEAGNLDRSVIHYAVTAYQKARQKGYGYNRHILSIIDYSKPSSQRRLWVFDLDRHKLLYNEFVAHGKNSGDKVASRFSNAPNSLQSSIGLYMTGSIYQGHQGISLRLNGLEPGYNDRALQRAIVMHGAWYASPTFIRQHGGVGHSWGCPAINPAIAKQVINTIANGSLVFAYYPDKNWLANSRFF